MTKAEYDSIFKRLRFTLAVTDAFAYDVEVHWEGQ